MTVLSKNQRLAGNCSAKYNPDRIKDCNSATPSSFGKLFDLDRHFMTRAEFLYLRDLPGKIIDSDIVWKQEKGVRPNKVFSRVLVKNSLGLEVWLNGTFKPTLVATTYNFVLLGTGPICRVDVNGPEHQDQGRTHKHDLRFVEDSEPGRNLPTAVARPDLASKDARQVWDVLCKQANIFHRGRFYDP